MKTQKSKSGKYAWSLHDIKNLRKENKNTKEELANWKALKILYEDLVAHTSFDFMLFHMMAYSGSPSIKDYYILWKLNRRLKKINKRISKFGDF